MNILNISLNKENHLGLHVPTLTINSDHQSIKDAIAYVNEQEDLHKRIMVLHHELPLIGGNAMPPSPPYKNVRWVQLENSYNFQIGRRYHLKNFVSKSSCSQNMLPDGKLQEDEFLFWTRQLEQQVYWKEQFSELEQFPNRE